MTHVNEPAVHMESAYTWAVQSQCRWPGFAAHQRRGLNPVHGVLTFLQFGGPTTFGMSPNVSSKWRWQGSHWTLCTGSSSSRWEVTIQWLSELAADTSQAHGWREDLFREKAESFGLCKTVTICYHLRDNDVRKEGKTRYLPRWDYRVKHENRQAVIHRDTERGHFSFGGIDCFAFCCWQWKLITSPFSSRGYYLQSISNHLSIKTSSNF